VGDASGWPVEPLFSRVTTSPPATAPKNPVTPISKISIKVEKILFDGIQNLPVF
jgi:hypothetical protein